MSDQPAYMAEIATVAAHRWQQHDQAATAHEDIAVLDVDGRTYFPGPRGFGTEDPDTSTWCTRDPNTCQMYVRHGTTAARASRGWPGPDHPDGTCMLLPPDPCRHDCPRRS